MTGDITAAVAAGSFWMFIAVVVIAGVVGSVFRHHETQQTIRKAMESGQSLDPETLDRLLRSARPGGGPPPRNFFLVFGVMMLAIGGGLVAIGFAEAASHTNPSQLYQGLGAGAMVGLIGVGLLVAGRLISGPSGNAPGNGQE
jgi:hypothetical protein